MKDIFFSILGATWLCFAFSFHIATKNIAVMNEVTDWFFNRNLPHYSLYPTAIIMAIIYRSAGRPGSIEYRIVSKCSDHVLKFYASTAGTYSGWIAGLLCAAIASNPKQYLLISIPLFFLLLITIFSPLVMAVEARNNINRLNDNFLRNDLKAFVIRRVGDTTFVFTALLFIYEFFFKT